MVSITMLSILAPIIVLLSPVHAWVATEYVEIAVIGSKGDSYTATSYLRPTAAVTPYSTSTSTDNDNGDQLTLIQLLLSGTNLPVTVPSVSTPTGTEFVSTIYYAPATITAPPTCTGTKFSYVTPVPVEPPTIMLQSPNSIAITSSTAYMTTTFFINADGQTTSSSTWSEVDFYLQTGQVLPTLDPETDVMLGFCQDPRGCYLGQGAGCTASAGGVSGFLGGLTESNGLPATATSKSTSTASASAKKNAAGRLVATGGEGVWVLMGVSAAGLFGAMIIL